MKLPENIYSINAVSVTLEALSGLQITSQAMKCDIAVSREENKKAVAENDVIYTYSVKKDGKEKKYSSYTKLIKQLNGSTITGWNVKKPSGKPDVTITLSFFDEGKQKHKPERIEFYRYSAREYAVVREGLPVNTVSATWVNQLLSDAVEL